jgi:hypothetical protein
VIKLAWRRAGIVLAGSALALAGGLIPAQAAATGWRTDATVATRGYETIFTSVAASSRSNAWAAGLTAKAKGDTLAGTAIRHWTGKAWRSVTLPAKTAKAWAKAEPLFPEVGAASARSVWVFGGIYGGYLRLDGSKWSVATLPGGGAKSGTLVEIDAVKVFSSSNVWAFGTLDSLTSTTGAGVPYAAQYNGHSWSSKGVPGSGTITAVAAPSAGEMWAVEDAAGDLSEFGIQRTSVRTHASSAASAAPVVLQWTGSTWQQAAEQPALSGSDEITSAAAEPNGDIWIGGSATNKAGGTTPVAAEWDGTAWSSVSDLPMKASSADWQLEAMAPDGSGGLWALAFSSSGSGRIWQLTGSKWSTASTSFGKHEWALLAVTLVPGTRSAWAAGALRESKSGADGLIAVTGALPR